MILVWTRWHIQIGKLEERLIGKLFPAGGLVCTRYLSTALSLRDPETGEHKWREQWPELRVNAQEGEPGRSWQGARRYTAHPTSPNLQTSPAILSSPWLAWAINKSHLSLPVFPPWRGGKWVRDLKVQKQKQKQQQQTKHAAPLLILYPLQLVTHFWLIWKGT